MLTWYVILTYQKIGIPYLLFSSQLPAAGLDIDPSSQADGAGDATAFQLGLKKPGSLVGRRLSVEFFGRVQGDNVHMTKQAF
jgi:hypothetical protein